MTDPAIGRRDALRRLALAGVAGGGLAAAPRLLKARAPSTADVSVNVLLDESIATIEAAVYSQFAEHIGGVIYDGVWVGRDSKIRNYDGIRAELVDMLKKIQVPVIRWPGGCFADSYDWRDGIGLPSKRPRTTNFWEVDRDAQRLHEKGAQIFETNQFGTNEFMHFCELTGAQPYLAANVRSLPALDFDDWVEYCNSPAGSTTLADARAAGGFPEPFNVRYWGIGNESWGCGGSFLPEDYAAVFRRYTAWIPKYGVDLQLVASGPNGNDIDWTHRFFEELYGGPHAYRNPELTGWSVHHYATNPKLDALQFGPGEWFDILYQCDLIRKIISDQWAVMGQYDKEHRVKLVVDEYGPWYREGTEVDITHIFGQQVTVRDALATALTLDAFNRNPDKVSLATNAQLVNNINALFLTHEDRFVATPNYYVFAMYAAHQGGQALRAEFAAPSLSYSFGGRQQSFWGLDGSASRKGNVVTLTMVNPELAGPKQTQVALRGFQVKQATGVVLTAGDIHAHNTFDRPDAVHPARLAAEVSGGMVNVSLPAASVSRLEIVLT